VSPPGQNERTTVEPSALFDNRIEQRERVAEKHRGDGDIQRRSVQN